MPTGLLLLLPTYYALAIVARLGPLPFSCFLLGATIDIHAPSTVAAISIAVLLALTARSIFRELRQVDDIKDCKRTDINRVSLLMFQPASAKILRTDLIDMCKQKIGCVAQMISSDDLIR
eukprot:COSAG04_NODE_981_length_9013_cov_4.862928_7_plen_120_part_00